MSQLQSKIEQIAKEYIDYKNLYEKESQKIKSKDFLEKLSSESLQYGDDINSIFGNYFDKIGSIEILRIDLNQLKTQLYHYIKVAEDIVEIPKEIKELVDDYKFDFIYTVSNGEKEIVNKELFEQYKDNYIKSSLELQNLQNKSQ